MIPFAEMPADNAQLANLSITFAELEPNTPESCPVSLADIVEYLQLESPDTESVRAVQLRFLRTAQLAECRYWLWAFRESDGTDCYVTVSLSPDGTACTGYDDNYYGLSPEQYLLGDYHNVF